MITVSHLSKKYGEHLAVDDLSFTIEEGHIYGFLGPNGAGKSTTMNIMTGCLAATDGEVSINGHDIFEDSKMAKKEIGYLPEMPPLYIDQTVEEYLQFVAEAKRVPRATRAQEIQRVIAETHIEEMAGKLIKQLSKGYKQRVGIAQALLGDPQVIILDEPTVGLDPMQIIEIRDLICELGKKHTVILSSHILSEVQAVCDRILIIYKGKLVAFDTPENLSKSLASGHTIQLALDTDEAGLSQVLEGIEEITGTQVESSEEGSEGCRIKAVLTINSEEADPVARQIFKACAQADIAILQMNPVKTSLEDIFLELTTKSAEESEIIAEEMTSQETSAADISNDSKEEE